MPLSFSSELCHLATGSCYGSLFGWGSSHAYFSSSIQYLEKAMMTEVIQPLIVELNILLTVGEASDTGHSKAR